MSINRDDPFLKDPVSQITDRLKPQQPLVLTPEEAGRPRPLPTLPVGKAPKAKKGKKQKLTAKSPEIRRQLLAAGYGQEEIDFMFGANVDFGSPEGQGVLSQALRTKYIERAASYGISQEEVSLRVLKARGVPAGFRPLPSNIKGPPSPVPGTPDEYSMFFDALIEPYSWNKEQVSSLQSKMQSAGLLRKGSFHPGYFDDATLQAYRGTLVEASRANKTPFELLSDYELSKPNLGEGFAPRPFLLTDPAEVELFATTAWAKATGKGPDESQKAALIGAYREFERKAYEQQTKVDRYTYEAGAAAELGISAPSAPTIQGFDPESRVELEALESEEADEYTAIKYGLQLRSLLGGE